MIRERWGEEFVDNRDWKSYNEELVARGNFYLDFDWVKSWNEELEKMNENKRGAPFEFPESLIKLQAIWSQWIDYRGVEGITRQVADYGLIPQFNDFSTINRRVNKLELNFQLPESGDVCVTTDGTSVKMCNGGSHRERKYGNKRKKYLKIVITADPKRKKLLDVDVSIEGEGDSEPDIAERHTRELMGKGKKVEKFWGDGSYDDKDLFDFLKKNKIEPAIKIRKNAVVEGGNSARDKEVIKYRKKGYKKWAREKEYGQRWNGTEGIISAVKRKFGENIRATKIENMVKEATRKFWAYNHIKEYTKISIFAKFCENLLKICEN